MSEIRRSVVRVRQLSLQPPTPRRLQLRRQKTSDDEQSSKIHNDPIGSDRSRVNSRSGSSKPKVRIAWSERHRENNSIEQVEVVARQITGKSKSTTKKSRNRNIIENGEKASILYSRQELTERLRLAWKHREENKTNIDIYLAHGVREERCNSESSNYPAISEPQTPPPPPPVSKNEILRSSENDRHPITDSKHLDNSYGDDTCEIQTTKRTDSFESRTDLDKDIKETKRPKKTKVIENNLKVVETSSVKLQNDVCYSEPIERIKYVESTTNETLKGTIEVSVDQSNKNEKSVSIEAEDNIKLPTLKSEITALNVSKSQNEATSAKQKRANFRNGTNRAFLYTETDKTVVSKMSTADTDVQRSSLCKRTTEMKQIEAKNVIKNVNDQKLNRKSRSSSAPLQGRNSSRIQVNIVIDTNCDSKNTIQKNSNEINDKGKVNEEGVLDKKKDILLKPSYVRPIKSAPLKKRLKSIKKRQHSLGSACKDEQCNNGLRGRCGLSMKDCDGKSNDVITMVSLVSSTESDSDLENSPNEAKLIDQLREKLSTTPIIKTSTTPIPGNIRKSVKSVSFQRDSFDEDCTLEKTQFDCIKTKATISQNHFIKDSKELSGEYGTSKESIHWKSNEIKTAFPMLSFIQDESESLCVPLMDHDMRSLAVPIGNVDDMKKKSHRIRNTSTVSVLDKKATMIEMKKDNEIITTDDQLVTRRSTISNKFLLSNVNPNTTEISLKEKNSDAISIETEPRFQTRKEKDCWHLYKRMCDKGVNVSFDTVLRGMLTPTEYRLRQKECSENF
ncbi:PREDICTED: uncharacterized protein LOC106792557 isoform X1 [Polistes canadensis]|uniref:uncharacterized protein LOC106792557 isoform X1 n=1 Tax=Polistes canadensis TaxID=91411 RepID=UPI00071905C2|nr:PREDICTED: uncharacterized protein LOC106792557 isoform X1 [Polistes canadensis]